MIHRNMERAAYDAIPRLSCSQLKPLRKSPRAFKHALANKREETDALRIGHALDLRVLTPDLYSQRVAIAPECDRRTKAGKATWADFVAASAGKDVLSLEESALVEGMAASIFASPKVAEYLSGETQVAVEWEADGVELKSLLDLVTRNGALLDLKSTRILDPDGFGWDAWRLGYHIQGAMYADAWKQATGEDRPFCFLAVEKTPPYECCIYVMGDDDLRVGREEYRRLLAIYRSCREADKWPGVTEVQFLKLPRRSGVEFEGFSEES